eukprot:SAG25_NODE_250_length_11019_cov_7.950092_4_plen_185_part_00
MLFGAPNSTPRANMLVEVAAALVEDDRAAETLGAVRPGRPGLSGGPGPAARAASPRPSLSSLHGRFVLRVALSCVAQGQCHFYTITPDLAACMAACMDRSKAWPAMTELFAAVDAACSQPAASRRRQRPGSMQSGQFTYSIERCALYCTVVLEYSRTVRACTRTVLSQICTYTYTRTTVREPEP